MGYQNFVNGWNMPLAGLNPALFALLLIWSLAWKGLALWEAARREDKAWFVILLIVNTAGILEIIYLFAVAKIQRTQRN